MTVLVTGGAGYIGSHVVRLLRERGDEVVIVDDLISGDRRRLDGVPLIVDRLDDPGAVARLAAILRERSVTSVIHFAARKRVDESVARPAWYFAQNIGGLAHVLLAMEEADVHHLVFSSSAAVYGATEGEAITETDPTVPINPYGASKLVGEQLITAAARAQALDAISLRYFNVAGAGWPALGDTAVLNLIPMVFERIDAGRPPLVFGTDYPTRDGSCVRDFVHVLDLAGAHLRALDALEGHTARHRIYNVGTGRGTTVLEAIALINEVSGAGLEPEARDRRPGDPAVVVADPSAFTRDLGWVASLSTADMIESAWHAHQYLAGSGA